jgi:hypothetical protein
VAAQTGSAAVLGNRTNLPEAEARGVASNRKAADAFAANVLPVVRQIQAAGATTFRQHRHAGNAPITFAIFARTENPSRADPPNA